MADVSFRNLQPRFFEGLSQPEIKAITSMAEQRHYPAGSVIVRQGNSADHLFLLKSGRARYFYVTPDGRKVILFWIPAGEIFGGATMLPQSYEYLLCTETTKQSSMLVWNRSTMRALAARSPRLIDNVLGIMFDYLVAYRAAHVSMTFHAAPQRLAQVLANLALGIGQKVPGGMELDVRNEELANEANVTPFTASRLLREWQRQGIVRKSRGKIVLHSAERLPLEEI